MSTTVEYTRPRGRRHTYSITADDRGRFVIALGDRVLKRSGTSAVSRQAEPSPHAQAECIRRAQVTLDYLIGMREE